MSYQRKKLLVIVRNLFSFVFTLFLLENFYRWKQNFGGKTFRQSLVASYQSLVTSHQSLVTSYQLLVTSYQLLVTSHQLIVTDRQSLVASYQSLVISYYSLVASHELLVNTSHQFLVNNVSSRNNIGQGYSREIFGGVLCLLMSIFV